MECASGRASERGTPLCFACPAFHSLSLTVSTVHAVMLIVSTYRSYLAPACTRVIVQHATVSTVRIVIQNTKKQAPGITARSFTRPSAATTPQTPWAPFQPHAKTRGASHNAVCSASKLCHARAKP